jgi:hypothetical protein
MKTALAALLLLLGCASSRESAQVVWQRLGDPDKPGAVEWATVDAASTETACKAALLGAVKSRSPSQVEVRGNNPYYEMYFLKMFALVCLPDTIDPGGPKGK